MEKQFLSIGVLLILGAALFLNSQDSNIENIASYQLFNQWKQQYQKHYLTENDQIYRFKIFRNNLEMINKHNNDPTITYKMGLNQFADLTEQEFVGLYLNVNSNLNNNSNIKNIEKNQYIPNGQARDWVAEGKVPAIDNQGSCGSSWAFGAVNAIEINNNIKYNENTRFSVQDMLDCSKSYGNNGCSGGWMNDGYQYVIDHGIATAAVYPYVGKDQACKNVDRPFKKVVSYVETNTCQKAASAILQNALSGAADASKWSFYASGIFNSCATDINHGVSIVGIDENGVWKVRNQWGVQWGEQGYIRLAAGNTCGICDSVSYPVLQ